MLSSTALPTVLAGIIAKGLGIIAAIFGIGLVIGVVLTLLIAGRIRGARNRR